MEDTVQVPEFHKQDERILAALAHGAILLPIYGIIIPTIIWITQKEKTRYVSFQSLQALAFHLTLLFLYMIACCVGPYRRIWWVVSCESYVTMMTY
jgi:uncharacterized Tic20 family protein